ncbi:MAG: VWA domain-containing protein [Planctomycetes bacterium]|nr:VWA domain-containing protein [Planctomycetota bacterium]
MKWTGIVVGLGILAAFAFGGCAYRVESRVGGQALQSMGAPGFDSRYAGSEELGRDEDELWIVPRSPDAIPPRPTPQQAEQQAALADGIELDELPGCGGLVAEAPGTGRRVVLPLERTDVKGTITGALGDVSVTQRFTNPYGSKIEAVYVFPLPENGAVRDFLMTIGARTIRGVVRERAEAERMYASAKRAGKVAALLTEERPNVFTQRVANLEPGKTIDVTLRYLHGLRWVDDAFEFTFPMVVGPRYTPKGSASGIGAVSAGASGTSGQPVEVPYLRVGERSGNDVSIALRIASGLDYAAIESRTHAVRLQRLGGLANGVVDVELEARDHLANKDFVLRLQPAGSGARAGLVAGGTGSERFFQLTLVPPADLASTPRTPIEAVFVVDCSGSMAGAPLDTVKRALYAALYALRPGDAFQFVQFNQQASTLGDTPIPVDARGLEIGRAWLHGLVAEGGTEVLAGVRAAIGLPRDPSRERVVCFLTDGHVANEEEILREIRLRRDDLRVHAFGIGSAPNRYLLEELALEGRGAAAWLREGADPGRAMERFVERASHPALADLELDFGRWRVRDVYPSTLPDLVPGRAVVITGRVEDGEGFDGSGVVVRGRAGGRRRELVVGGRTLENGALADALSWLWARARIADLGWRARGAVSDDERRAFAKDIQRTALEHGLLSAYTAFIAVDSLSQTAGDHGYTVPVSAPVPAGMRYETQR